MSCKSCKSACYSNSKNSDHTINSSLVQQNELTTPLLSQPAPSLLNELEVTSAFDTINTESPEANGLSNHLDFYASSS